MADEQAGGSALGLVGLKRTTKVIVPRRGKKAEVDSGLLSRENPRAQAVVRSRAGGSGSLLLASRSPHVCNALHLYPSPLSRSCSSLCDSAVSHSTITWKLSPCCRAGC